VSNVDPTSQEIQQWDAPDPKAVDVEVVNPIKTQQMGAVMWATRRYSIDNSQAQRVLNANPKRFRAVITVRGQIAYLGASQAEASPSSQGVILAAPSSIELRHTQEAWIIGGNASASEIGVVEEFWAN
jgi:hypothetical protein